MIQTMPVQQASGKVAAPRADMPNSNDGESIVHRHAGLVLSIATAVLIALAWTLSRWAGLPHPATVALYLMAYACGSFMLGVEAVRNIRRGSFALNIDFLMIAAAVGAAVLGKWAEGAFLLFLFSLANALEHYALGRARNAIRALADLSPPTARVLHDGVETVVSIDRVIVGDTVVVRPAERIPVDGRIHRGDSAVDQSPITGESVPVEKAPGDEVFAGTINGSGALEIINSRAVGDRTLDRVIRLVSEAQSQRAPTQVFTDRLTKIFVPSILVMAALLIVAPPWLGWLTWSESFYRAMTVLVGASPCALALGAPATVLAGIAQAARKGVLIKGGAHLEHLGTVSAIAFDKTGTLTVGKPEVTDIVPAAGASSVELLTIAAAVERRSQHPLAAAIVRRAAQDSLDLPSVGDLQSVTAKGVRSPVEGQVVEIGSLKLWDHTPDGVPQEIRSQVSRLQAAGRSIVVVRWGVRWLGVLGVMDRPRPSARATLDTLRTFGVRSLVMLTGDNKGVGAAVGSEVGVDQVHADLLPEDKVAVIKDLLKTHRAVAMVGDGVNDAPALAQATVGIAMGGAGTAVALETADVALMGDDLYRLPFAIALSRRSRAIIRQNVIFALAVIVVLIIAGATGVATIGPAVLLHEGSTILVVLNALRLLAFNTRQS